MKRLGLLTLALALAVPMSASAQALEEIVVTARKREENLQDVPLSVSAFSEAFIAESGANDITDVAKFTPNLSFRRSFGRAFDRPAIRGQGPILGAQTVGLFIDGIFIAGTLSSTPLDNIERIEVVKGPQSAMFGRATLAGAINYVTKKPGNEWEGKFLGTIAEHDEYEARAFISGPIIEDQLAFNLGIRHFQYGGEWDNFGPGGGTVGQEETDSVYATLYWTPTENFDATFKINWFEDDDGHPANDIAIDSPDLNCFLNAFRGYYCGEIPNRGNLDLELTAPVDYGIERETIRTSLELNWDVNDYTLTSMTAYAKEDEDWIFDFGWETNEFFFWNGLTSTINEELEYKSQEFRIASPADRPFRWLAGAYFYDEESVDPTDLSRAEIENQAVFGQIEYDFNDRWTGSVELRWAEDEITDVTGQSLSQTFDSVNPRASITWRQTDDATIYASISKGTKPGDFNAAILGNNVPLAEQQRLANLIPVEEEEAVNFEIGTKRSYADGRVNLTLAAFLIDWSEQQLTSSEAFTDTNGLGDTLAIIRNIGETDVIGFEFGLLAQLTEGLEMNLTWGLTDAEIKFNCDSEWGAFQGPDPVACDQARFPGAANMPGNQTPNTPRNSISLTLDYRTQLTGGMDFFVRTDGTYESTRYAQVFNLAETGDSAIVNFRTGLKGEQWTATLWVKNLNNETSPDSLIRFIDFDTLFFGIRRAFQMYYPRGRQFGVSFEYNF